MDTSEEDQAEQPSVNGTDETTLPVALPPSVAIRLSALDASIDEWDWRTQDVSAPVAASPSRSERPTEVRAEPAPQPPTAPSPPPQPPISHPEPAPTVARSRWLSRLNWRSLSAAGHPIWLGVGAAAFLVAIIGAIFLLTSGGSTPRPSTTTQQTLAGGGATASTTPSTTPPTTTPESAVATAKFNVLTHELLSANVTLTDALTRFGSHPTLAEVGTAQKPYASVLETYEFEAHDIQWPATMSADVQTFYSEMDSYADLVTSFPTVTQATLPSWLLQLKSRAATAQSAENTMRRDLGLPTSDRFP